MNASSRSLLLVAILAGATSGVASTLVLRLASGERAGESLDRDLGSSSSGGELAGVRTQISELAQQISAMRLEIGRMSPGEAGDSAARDEAAAPSSLAPEAQLAALNLAVADLAKRLDVSLPPHIPAWTAPDETKRAALEPFFDRKKNPPIKSYLYFTEAELLAAFGPPNGIAPMANGTHCWMYVESPSPADKPPRAFQFNIVGGRVSDYTRD